MLPNLLSNSRLISFPNLTLHCEIRNRLFFSSHYAKVKPRFVIETILEHRETETVVTGGLSAPFFLIFWKFSGQYFWQTPIYFVTFSILFGRALTQSIRFHWICRETIHCDLFQRPNVHRFACTDAAFSKHRVSTKHTNLVYFHVINTNVS